MTASTHNQEPQPTAEQPDTTAFLFYCDMLALSSEERQFHQALIGRLFGNLVLETRELADGYAYGFAGEHYQLVAEFITHERLCCPFLTFGLTVTPERGPVWLHLTAPGDVKPFLTEELGHYIAQS
jgi:hypothetical protein